MSKIRVALGLSGGVDSAVSAYLLKKSGYDVHCVYLNCFDSDTPGCRGDQDRKDALAVAMHLGLPFQVLDFRKEYQAAVIDYFKKEYLLGRTPNPDVVCNRDIKFGLFLDWVVKAGFDYVATGHYAKLRSAAFSRKSRNKTKIAKNNSRRSRSFASFANTKAYTYDQLQENNNSVFLVQPRDVHKDQTYFLWAVPRQKFSRVLFPLGNLLKSEVREIAKDAGLGVADKKDSTGICFVGEVRVEDFLKSLGVKEKKGEVVVRTPLSFPRRRESIQIINIDSGSKPGMTKHTYEVVGRHKGVWFYTIGQRHGFEITNWPPVTSSLRGASRDKPVFYVIEKDIKKNRLIVGFGAETYREKFVVGSCNWLIDDEFFSQTQNSKLKTQNLAQSLKLEDIFVRIRHGGDLMPCQLLSVSSRKLEVALATPARGIAAGQSAVFYTKGGIILGGGIIDVIN